MTGRRHRVAPDAQPLSISLTLGAWHSHPGHAPGLGEWDTSEVVAPQGVAPSLMLPGAPGGYALGLGERRQADAMPTFGPCCPAVPGSGLGRLAAWRSGGRSWIPRERHPGALCCRLFSSVCSVSWTLRNFRSSLGVCSSPSPREFRVSTGKVAAE